MGLFDGYYDPQSYSGGGSLIDRLLAQLGTQGQYQPSQGFGSNPMDANAAVPPIANAPAPNAPIAVGDYSMPRIGAGFSPPQINPQTGETVSPQPAPTAQAPMQQPMQAPQPPMPVQPRAPQQPSQQLQAYLQPQHSPGGFGGLFRGAVANLQNGPLGILGGAIGGAMGMGEGTEQEQQKRAVQQTYQMLVNAGVPEQKAVLAAISPEYAKTIIPAELGSDKFAFTTLPDGTVVRQNAKTGEVAPAYQGGTKPKFVQLKDGTGAEHPAFVNEVSQTVNGQPIAEYNKQQGATAGGLGNMDLTGKEYLTSLPPQERNIVQGMAEGTIAPPSSFAMAKPVWTARIAAAKNYDPTFDATQWSGRVAGVRDFSAGKSSEMVRSANQTIGHVGDLIGKMDALNNGDYPMKNAVGNYVDTQTGGGATTGFHQTAHAVADELSKVFKGAGISDSEIKQWEQSLSPNMSPTQQREAVTTAMSLLQHSVSALEEKRLSSIGPMAAEKAGPLLKPDAQAAVERINKWAGGASGSTPAPTAPASGTAGPRKVGWSVVQ